VIELSTNVNFKIRNVSWIMNTVVLLREVVSKYTSKITLDSYSRRQLAISDTESGMVSHVPAADFPNHCLAGQDSLEGGA
jgi:hypothetical protein